MEWQWLPWVCTCLSGSNISLMKQFAQCGNIGSDRRVLILGSTGLATLVFSFCLQFSRIFVLHSTLNDDPSHPAWNRYIGLLVPHLPTDECLADSSYAGLGGWSLEDAFQYKWCLFHKDMVAVGFDMKAISEVTSKPDGTSDGLHINILEFIAMIINM